VYQKGTRSLAAFKRDGVEPSRRTTGRSNHGSARSAVAISWGGCAFKSLDEKKERPMWRKSAVHEGMGEKRGESVVPHIAGEVQGPGSEKEEKDRAPDRELNSSPTKKRKT